MRAIEAIIVWTPNREPFNDLLTTGQVEVATIPEPRSMKSHPFSVGACDLNWRDTDEQGRRELMQRYFTQMIHRDHIDEQTARKAVDAIDDFRGYHFSAERPGPTDDS